MMRDKLPWRRSGIEVMWLSRRWSGRRRNDDRQLCGTHLGHNYSSGGRHGSTALQLWRSLSAATTRQRQYFVFLVHIFLFISICLL